MSAAERSAIPIPPCACCGEPDDRYPLVWLRAGWLPTSGGHAYHAQYGCHVCEARGPLGAGADPEAALVDALTRAQADADRHRAWVAAGRPSLAHEGPAGEHVGAAGTAR